MTDPSYCGQLITFTFPMVGNYGVSAGAMESDRIHARAAIMRDAVDRIDAAIERKEPILIYGDYDVDGTMAVIILKTAIELCGGTCDFHVPHRIREGYDMRGDVIERAAAAAAQR